MSDHAGFKETTATNDPSDETLEKTAGIEIALKEASVAKNVLFGTHPEASAPATKKPTTVAHRFVAPREETKTVIMVKNAAPKITHKDHEVFLKKIFRQSLDPKNLEEKKDNSFLFKSYENFEEHSVKSKVKPTDTKTISYYFKTSPSSL